MMIWSCAALQRAEKVARERLSRSVVFGELRSAMVPVLSVAVVVLGRTGQLPGPRECAGSSFAVCARVPEPQFPS